jgi:hypothetical protein
MTAIARWIIVFIALAPEPAALQTEPGRMTDTRTQEAIELMRAFADRTGLTSAQPSRRYLWTDAFAVCNFLGLHEITGKDEHRDFALRLVDRVHHTLARHRDDDPRTGWISGLDEPEAERHPTRGGLRIGKPLPERGPDQAYDERLEWERDGQYFHYLTKWMLALDQVARRTREPRYNRWARELAETAEAAFSYRPAMGAPRMVWKMSIDLSRPLVPSMGQHDPLDGLVTAMQLDATAQRLSDPVEGPSLEDEIARYASMLQHSDLATVDPLGIGGLLTDAHRVQQLGDTGGFGTGDLVARLLAASLSGLQRYARSQELRAPAQYRLAFRELGLAIGLEAVRRMREGAVTDPRVRGQLQALSHFIPLGGQITAFWRDPAHRRSETWLEHRDINDVMLATSLVPNGFLDLSPGSPDPRSE